MKGDLNTRPAKRLRIIAFVWRLIAQETDYVITDLQQQNCT